MLRKDQCRAAIELLDKDSTIYPTSTVASKCARFWGIVQEMYKTHIIDVDERTQRLRTECATPDHVVIAAVSGVVAYQRASRPLVDILNTVCGLRHCSVGAIDGFVADIDDVSSYAPLVGMFLHNVRSGGHYARTCM